MCVCVCVCVSVCAHMRACVCVQKMLCSFYILFITKNYSFYLQRIYVIHTYGIAKMDVYMVKPLELQN